MATCAAYACSNCSNKECRLFPLPKDKANKALWADVICKAGKAIGWNPTSDTLICEFHFENSQFTENGDLIDQAVPSLFFPFTRKSRNCRAQRKTMSKLPENNSKLSPAQQPTTRMPKGKTDELKSNSDFCRLCAKPIGSKISVNIFDKNLKNDFNLFEFLLKAFDVEIRSEDELPQSICLRCDHKMDSIVSYRKECKVAEEMLKRWKASGKMEAMPPQKPSVSIVKRELDERFEFVCADEEAPSKAVTSVVSIEMREIKEEPEPDDIPAVSDDFVQNLAGDKKVHKEEPTDMDFFPDSDVGQDSDFDDEDDFPLKPKSKLKKQDDSEDEFFKKKWECGDCEEVFPNRTTLRNHRNTECEFVGTELSKKKRVKINNEVKREKKQPTTRQKRVRPDNDDDKQRIVDEILNQHKDDEDDTKLMRPKAPPRQWKCVDCETIFPSRSKLKKHRPLCELVGTPMSKRKKRSDETPIPCEFCGKMLSCKMGYKQHLSYCIGVDKGDKEAQALDKPPEVAGKDDAAVDHRVICHICGKKISQRSSMSAHIRFHTKEKPHKCNICSKSYYTSSELKEHSGSHDPVKSFICQVCGKGFSARSYLRKHMVVHDPRFKNIQCPFCPKKFIRKCEIQMHLLSHTGAPPNECNICQQKFRFTWELKKHLQKSHGIRDESATATAAEEQSYNQQQHMNMTAEPSSQATHSRSTVDDNSNASSNAPPPVNHLNPALARPHLVPHMPDGPLGIGLQTLYNLHTQIEESRYHNFPYL